MLIACIAAFVVANVLILLFFRAAFWHDRMNEADKITKFDLRDSDAQPLKTAPSSSPVTSGKHPA